MAVGVFSGGNRVAFANTDRITTWSISNPVGSGFTASAFNINVQSEAVGRIRFGFGGTNTGASVQISSADDVSSVSSMEFRQMIGSPVGIEYRPQEFKCSKEAPFNFESRLVKFNLSPNQALHITYESSELLDVPSLVVFWQENVVA